MAIITATDLKAHVGFNDSTDDTTITNAVNAVNQAIVHHCGRTFDDAGSATARVFWADTGRLVEVNDFHTTTGLVVKTDEGDDGTYETTWASTDYVLEPLNQLDGGITVPYQRIRAVESRTFPTLGRRPRVEVTARWGWASVPADVKLAALIQGARLWKRKDSPEGVAGFGEFGVVRVNRIDPDVADLLRPYVKHWPLVG